MSDAERWACPVYGKSEFLGIAIDRELARLPCVVHPSGVRHGYGQKRASILAVVNSEPQAAQARVWYRFRARRLRAQWHFSRAHHLKIMHLFALSFLR